MQVSKISEAIGESVAEVQDALYEQMVAEGWFSHRPDEVRHSWRRAGWILVAASLVACGLLVALTRFGLLGIVPVAVCIAFLASSMRMPWRTPTGGRGPGRIGGPRCDAGRPAAGCPAQTGRI